MLRNQPDVVQLTLFIELFSRAFDPNGDALLQCVLSPCSSEENHLALFQQSSRISRPAPPRKKEVHGNSSSEIPQGTFNFELDCNDLRSAPLGVQLGIPDHSVLTLRAAVSKLRNRGIRENS